MGGPKGGCADRNGYCLLPPLVAAALGKGSLPFLRVNCGKLIFLAMRNALAHRPASELHVRRGRPGDLDDLIELENRAFATDHISRRAFRRLLASPQAETIVVEHDGRLAGYALVLFRSGSAVARLYSIAVARHSAGRGVGPTLLAAAEQRGARSRLRRAAARSARGKRRGDRALPEVRLHRVRAPPRLLRGQGDALRFEKRLTPRSPPSRAAALFSPDHRVHLRAGLHDDGARLGGTGVAPQSGARVQAVARGDDDLHDLGSGRLRALWARGRAAPSRALRRGACEPQGSLLPRHGGVRGQAAGHAARPRRSSGAKPMRSEFQPT